MKKIYIIFTISFSFLNTYGQDFQSFKRIENNFTWIVPLDLEREFEALQQEVWEKGFDLEILVGMRKSSSLKQKDCWIQMPRFPIH